MFFIQVLTVSILISTSFCATLRFYGADQSGGISNWKRGKAVRTKNFTVCPDELPSPFTLVCIPGRPASSAEFFVDGFLRRTERVIPYTIAGDSRGIAQPWNPRTTVNVECRLDTGEKVKATIHLVCSDSGSAKPSTTKPTVAVTTSTVAPPTFQLGSAPVGSSSGDGVPTGQCVRIPALDYVSADLDATKWVKRGDALFYRPTDKKTSINRDPASAVATYKFKAPVTATYGFTLDMETNGVVEHNDVWILFESGGFILQRGESRKVSSGWTKAYHNRNGRSNQIFSVDFNPHTFSTRARLAAGREYTVKVGGRSTKTGFYSIVMFPCDRTDGECDGTRGNQHWQNSREKCA